MLTTFPMNDIFNARIARDSARRDREELEYAAKLEDNRLCLTVDVPGVRVEDLNVEYMDGYVTVSAKREEAEKSITLRVNDDYELEDLNARHELGVLYLEVPKKPKKVPKKVPVKT